MRISMRNGAVFSTSYIFLAIVAVSHAFVFWIPVWKSTSVVRHHPKKGWTPIKTIGSGIFRPRKPYANIYNNFYSPSPSGLQHHNPRHFSPRHHFRSAWKLRPLRSSLHNLNHHHPLCPLCHIAHHWNKPRKHYHGSGGGGGGRGVGGHHHGHFFRHHHPDHHHDHHHHQPKQFFSPSNIFPRLRHHLNHLPKKLKNPFIREHHHQNNPDDGFLGPHHSFAKFNKFPEFGAFPKGMHDLPKFTPSKHHGGGGHFSHHHHGNGGHSPHHHHGGDGGGHSPHHHHGGRGQSPPHHHLGGGQSPHHHHNPHKHYNYHSATKSHNLDNYNRNNPPPTKTKTNNFNHPSHPEELPPSNSYYHQDSHPKAHYPPTQDSKYYDDEEDDHHVHYPGDSHPQNASPVANFPEEQMINHPAELINSEIINHSPPSTLGLGLSSTESKDPQQQQQEDPVGEFPKEFSTFGSSAFGAGKKGHGWGGWDW